MRCNYSRQGAAAFEQTRRLLYRDTQCLLYEQRRKLTHNQSKLRHLIATMIAEPLADANTRQKEPGWY